MTNREFLGRLKVGTQVRRKKDQAIFTVTEHQREYWKHFDCDKVTVYITGPQGQHWNLGGVLENDKPNYAGETFIVHVGNGNNYFEFMEGGAK